MANVRVKIPLTNYLRYQVAYVQDYDRKKESWNRRPRMATNKEVREYFQDEVDNYAMLRLSDLCPNFNDDGTIEKVSE